MQKKATRIASVAGLLIAALALTGCSFVQALPKSAGVTEQSDTDADAGTDTSTEADADAEETEEPATDDVAPAVAGELLQPGQTVAPGDWATYEYVNYDNLKAVLQTKLVSVEPATQSQLDFLVGEIPDLKDWNVVLIRFQQQKVSGDDITYNANYTDFDPADINGQPAQYVSAIGWDDCATNSFTEEFNAGTEVLDQCIIGAYLDGDAEIGGMIWSGNGDLDPDDNPFDTYDGKPVFFQK